jgi:hypothetical protein
LPGPHRVWALNAPHLVLGDTDHHHAVRHLASRAMLGDDIVLALAPFEGDQRSRCTLAYCLMAVMNWSGIGENRGGRRNLVPSSDRGGSSTAHPMSGASPNRLAGRSAGCTTDLRRVRAGAPRASTNHDHRPLYTRVAITDLRASSPASTQLSQRLGFVNARLPTFTSEMGTPCSCGRVGYLLHV